jgi:large subunit ribosomal protein L35
MPKIKSHSGAKKRFKVTGTGKVVHGMTGKRHLLSNKPRARKKTLRGTGVLFETDAERVHKMLPYA